jgi:tetratricopeptide (TPR) repeat protein
VLLANALRATKDYLGAEAAYKNALALEPNLHEVHFNLGVLYIDNGVGDPDELVRLQRGVAELRSFEERTQPDPETKARLVNYLDSTDKRIGREAKRRERDQKRKADDAKKSGESTPGPASEVLPKAPASTAEVVHGED